MADGWKLTAPQLPLDLDNHPFLCPIIESLGILRAEQNAAIGHRVSKIACPQEIKPVAIRETMKTIHKI